jgi:hypothetical protein
MESLRCGVDAAVEDLSLVGELLGELALGRDVREQAVLVGSGK